MPRISQLPALTVPEANDEIAIVDASAATTKKITRADLLESLYPVGSIYINASVATNPATLIGFGVWEAFGTGRVLVGIDAGQAEFDTLGKTGGHKELQAHTHSILGRAGSSALDHSATAGYFARATTSSGSDSGSATQSTGGGDSGNLQPYIVVHMWRRTA